MQGTWLEKGQLSFRDDLPMPQILSGEALIRVRLAGICATDLEMIKGYYTFSGIPGHEFVGTVEQAPGQDELVGKRVVGEINASCGQCQHCLAGRKTHCEKRTVLGLINRDGVFAQYCSLPNRNLYLIPDELADECAVFTEPLAAAIEILEQVQIKPSDHVLLVGAGRLGQLIAQVVQRVGCDLSVLVRHQRQKDLLMKRKIKILSEEEILPGRFDNVIDASGSAQGFQIIRRAVRPRGTIVLKSTYKGELVVNMSSIVVDEITVIGSRCGPFPPAIRMLANHQVEVDDMIDAYFPLNDGLKAFKSAGETGALKVLLQAN